MKHLVYTLHTREIMSINFNMHAASVCDSADIEHNEKTLSPLISCINKS